MFNTPSKWICSGESAAGVPIGQGRGAPRLFRGACGVLPFRMLARLHHVWLLTHAALLCLTTAGACGTASEVEPPRPPPDAAAIVACDVAPL
jgi:hypothetical protein